MRINFILLLSIVFLMTTATTSKQASFDQQASVCTFQGRIMTTQDQGTATERVALVLNQRTNLETTIELLGHDIKKAASHKGFRAEVELEIREDILGSVSWAKFRKVKRILDPYEETEEYITSKAIREVCRKSAELSMRFLFLFLSLFTILTNALAVTSSIKHVVLDIDWTLVSPLEEGGIANAERMITIEGERYRVSDGVEEMVESLLKRGDVKISFFSGGEPSRNNALLKAIRLKDGTNRTLFDIADKILDKADMTDLFPGSEGMRFKDRYRKDLLKIDSNLENIILVDDVKLFSLAGQEKNMLWLGQTYDHYETWEQVVAAKEKLLSIGKSIDYLPLTEEAFLLDRDRMRTVQTLIEEALDDVRANPEKSFRQAVYERSQLARMVYRRKWARRECPAALLNSLFR